MLQTEQHHPCVPKLPASRFLFQLTSDEMSYKKNTHVIKLQSWGIHMRLGRLGFVIAFAIFGCANDQTQVDGDGDADQIQDGSTDSQPDGDENDGDIETNASELIDWVSPENGSLVRRNAITTIVFLNEIDPDTLLVELNDEAVDVVTTDNQEFRFVPLPLLEADTEYSVTIAAGVEDVLSNVLDGDFTWAFETEADEIDVTGDPELLAEEIDHILAGEVNEAMDLVQDWEDPDSMLYDISLPVDPDSEVVQHLIDRMMVSVVRHGGIGLAAPQIGIGRRLFVADIGMGFEAILNPVLTDYSENMGAVYEGCLSVPGEQIAVFRPDWIEFSYQQEDGTIVDGRLLEHPSGGASYQARIWLHEFDHLNGILLTDRASLY